MAQRRKAMMIGTAILVVALVALTGGILNKKGRKIQRDLGKESSLRCIYDGTQINPLYRVDAYLVNGESVGFCSIYCATRWHEANSDKALYFTVGDEMTGQRFDATLGHFVKSDVITVPEVKNRVHAFYLEEDALIHARQFNGTIVRNPFGGTFTLPPGARFDNLTIAVPALPDSIPLKLAIFRPIFKENRLEVDVVTYRGEKEGRALLRSGKVDGIVCDLPVGLLLATGSPAVRIVKNVLRANPFRPLFALVAGSGITYKGFSDKEKVSIALPDGVSFQFYAERYLNMLDMPLDRAVMRRVAGLPAAWDLLETGEVDAALLRTPYTDMARQKGMAYLADDRNLPWMSVLVLKEALIREKFDAIKRFIFALEQSVLALNLKPNVFREVIDEQVGVPQKAQKTFPMPLFEGGNAPAPDEIKEMINWLNEQGLIADGTSYERLINSGFLPNPEDVGLAFCCR